MEVDAVSVEKGEKKPKDSTTLVREPGKSLLPFARVQKIIKADKEIAIVARDATFLISLATEEFIKRLIESAHRIAEAERRATVQQRDISAVVRKADEFAFLEEIMGFMTQEARNTTSVAKKRRPKGTEPISGGNLNKNRPTLLDHFVKQPGEDDDGDVIMNEDGTMTVHVNEPHEAREQDED